MGASAVWLCREQEAKAEALLGRAIAGTASPADRDERALLGAGYCLRARAAIRSGSSFDQALDDLASAQALFEEVGEPLGPAEVARTHALWNTRVGRTALAVEYLEHAAAIEARLGRLEAVAEDLFHQALRALQRDPEAARGAVAAARRALLLALLRDDETNIVRAFGNLGAILPPAGEGEAARDTLSALLALVPSDPPAACAPGWAHLFLVTGLLHQDHEDYPAVLACCARAGRILDRRKADRLSRHRSIGAILAGSACASAGRFEEALQHLAAAANLLSHPPDDPLLWAWCHRTFAGVYFRRGQYRRTLARLGEAQYCLDRVSLTAAADRAADRAGDAVPSSAVIQNDLGVLYLRLGNPRRARACFERARAQLPGSFPPGFRASLGSNLGATLLNEGRYAEAVEVFAEVLALPHAAALPPHLRADLLNNVGVAHLSLGDSEEAASALAAAAQQYAELGLSEFQSVVLMNQGRLHLEAGEPSRAAVCYQAALTLRRDVGNPDGVGAALHAWGVVCEALGDASAAEAAYAEAKRGYARVVLEVPPAAVGPLQDSREGSITRLHRDYTALLARNERIAEAWVVSDHGRAVGLLRQAVENRVDFSSRLAPRDRERLEAARLALIHARQALDRLRDPAPPTDPSGDPAFRQRLAAAIAHCAEQERRLAVTQDLLFGRVPAFRESASPAVLDRESLDRLVKENPRTLFLEFLVPNESELFVFVLSAASGLRLLRLPLASRKLAAAVRTWRQSLEDPRQDETPLARWWYHSLLLPLEGAGILEAVDRIALVPDQALWAIPFGAMLDAQGRRLIQRFPISCHVSLGQWLRDEVPRQRAASPLGFLGVAASQSGRSPFLSGTEDPDQPLPPLPHAAREVEAISSLWSTARTEPARCLIGPDANLGRVMEGMVHAHVLHFAAHGLVDSREGLRSSLLLSPDPPGGSPQIPLLEAREIASTPLHAGLAVLSACRTGLGQSTAGEGLMGLVWAFHSAGCPRVTASLWDVPDPETADLMVHLYRALLVDRLPTDSALRQAALRLQSECPHPYYWASFQAYGHPSPLFAADPASRSPQGFRGAR